MNKNQINAEKEQMVAELKAGIEDSLIENFTDRHTEWEAKLKYVNMELKLAKDDIEPYTYNEFCKKIIEITKSSLEKGVDYDKLFLTAPEYLKTLEENANNVQEAEQAMLNELHAKFMDNLMHILAKDHLKEPIRYKLGEDFYLVESKLDKNIESARKLIKKNEENL